MTGKVCLITGGTRGIGLATARRLTRLGANVVIVGRTAATCTAAVNALQASEPGATVDWLAADLAVQADVRAVAAEFQRRHERLDVLVNNAGTIMRKRVVSPERVELTLAINHLAPFLLTGLLLDMLKVSAPARVVTVASSAHERSQADFSDLQLRRGYRPYRAYARSKLANLLFTYELGRRLEGSGVTANAVDPGLVRTGLGRSNGVLLDLAWGLTHTRYKSVSLTPDQGADTIVFLASSPDLAACSGGYFFQRKPAESSAASRDVRAAQDLWSLSEQLTSDDRTSPVSPR
jgi:NAD(P)-dependent dehydrogenase (short-subunit alcohol dehydrogenase family)